MEASQRIKKRIIEFANPDLGNVLTGARLHLQTGYASGAWFDSVCNRLSETFPVEAIVFSLYHAFAGFERETCSSSPAVSRAERASLSSELEPSCRLLGGGHFQKALGPAAQCLQWPVPSAAEKVTFAHLLFQYTSALCPFFSLTFFSS